MTVKEHIVFWWLVALTLVVIRCVIMDDSLWHHLDYVTEFAQRLRSGMGS